MGLWTDLVGCSEDDSRRKEKKIGGEEHMIGEEREGGRATEGEHQDRRRWCTLSGLEERDHDALKVRREREDKAEGKLLGTHLSKIKLLGTHLLLDYPSSLVVQKTE